MKRNKWNKDIDLMIRVAKPGTQRHTSTFYQEIMRFKFNFVSTPDVLGYLKIGTKAGKWELRDNKQVEADVVKFKMNEREQKAFNNYSQLYIHLIEGSSYEIVDNLGSCRFLEFRVKCKRPYYLTSKMSLLVTEREILILTSGEAPQFRLVDDFIKEFRAFYLNIFG